MRQASGYLSTGAENYIIGFDSDNDNGGSGSSSVVSCQDCGNQAKKDCQHKRCRTCCRSRGLPCKTHIKSTWVSAATRRERLQQQQLSLSSMSPHQPPHNDHHEQLSLMTISGGAGLDDHQQINHHRQHSGFAMPTTTTHLPNTSGFHFPEEVRSRSSLFQCVRVRDMDNKTHEHQLAYQTSINVGGHVFNGILYDHGPAAADHDHISHYNYNNVNQLMQVGESSSSTRRHQQETTVMEPSSSSSSIYQAPFCSFMAGTQYFPPPR
uniref:protein SHI RELATED SEQUENCE 5-like n=1 Tax=Erigeron canadensis TaxID=72917 RepID=UPI001CB90D98|nr:protein SHI RELATED SEQUENCE 5-like [Erigeron canadensis]